MQALKDIRKELKDLADPEKAKVFQRFFKTGPGQYGEGDIFLGVTVPESRKIAKKYQDATLKEIKVLLDSDIHEERLVSILILVQKYNKVTNKAEVVSFYLDNLKQINNWDLVDLSAPSIIGAFLAENNEDRSLLYRLAKSENVWERRIAIVATLWFIRNNEFEDTLKVSEILLRDGHDLIRKAVGWMLREVGKRNMVVEEDFVKKNCKVMPRTMLRYAIERFPEKKRMAYLNSSK